MTQRIVSSYLYVDHDVDGETWKRANLQISFGPPRHDHELNTGRPNRKTSLANLQYRSDSRVMKTRIDDVRSKFVDVQRNNRVQTILGEITGQDWSAQTFLVQSMHFPGTPFHVLVQTAFEVSTMSSQLVNAMNEQLLQSIEEQIYANGRYEWISVRLVLTFEKCRYPFVLQDDLIALTRQKLMNVLASGSYPPFVDQQWNAIDRMLCRAIRQRGPDVTEDEIRGVIEIATEHLWSPAMQWVSENIDNLREEL
jgi:hypothetical protein